jgi:hypothetical protein
VLILLLFSQPNDPENDQDIDNCALFMPFPEFILHVDDEHFMLKINLLMDAGPGTSKKMNHGG